MKISSANFKNSQKRQMASTEDETAQRQRRGRLETGVRSRSRGRTPSELLARKQQLLDQQHQHDSQNQEPRQASSSGQSSLQSAEAKLESLSVLLKHHQVSPSSAPQSSQDNKSQDVATGGRPQDATVQAADGPHRAASSSIDELYILLAKKEKDLQLAAELGKVLLERNEELSRANEKITEEYSHKLELLEQEKHKLKRKLDLLDGEYENRLIELQTDCNMLKTNLDQQQQVSRQAEKEKSKLIEDLVQQNQRLTSELAEATKSEELLSSQLEQVNERLGARQSNSSNHVAHVDGLQAEIRILSQRKQDLERRLKLAQAEKGQLNGSLEELGDRLLLLESLLNEKELKTGELAIEINELRDSSAWLSAKLESMISLNERLAGCADPDDPGQQDLRTISERDRSQLVEQLRELRLKRSSRMKANELILLDASERRRKSLMRAAASTGRRPRRAATGTPQSSGGGDDDDDDQLSSLSSGDGGGQSRRPKSAKNLSDLTSEIYFILNNFLVALQQRRDSFQLQNSSSSSSSSGQHSAGAIHHHHQLSSSTNLHQEDSGLGSADETNGQANQKSLTPSSSCSLADCSRATGGAARGAPTDLDCWRKLTERLRQLIEEMPCSSCQLMISERADFRQLQRLHAKVCEEIRLKNDELLRLNGENVEQAAQLGVLEDKCALLKEDLESCDKPEAEIVSLAWRRRDEAVARKNNAEIQLAKTRVENMQISSQLMEVVQQKGELSQKLAQFEDDIHYMMQRSVRARFTWEEYAEETRRLARGAATAANYGYLTSRLSNLVPSSAASASNNGAGQSNANDGQASSSSIQQLLSLTGVNLLSPTRRAPANNPPSNLISAPSSQDDGLQQSSKQPPGAAPTNLLSTLKTNTNKFSLRFWQRGPQSAPHDGVPAPTEAAVGVQST